MHELIQTVVTSQEQDELRQLIDRLRNSGKKYFLRNEVLQTFADYCEQTQKPTYFFHSSALGKLVDFIHELILTDDEVWLLVRPWIASQEIWSITHHLTQMAQRSPQELLQLRDALLASDRHQSQSQSPILEIDLHPFYENAPTIHDPRNIGQGLEFLNRHLCNQVLTDPQYWLDALFNVLHAHKHNGISLMINEKIDSSDQLVDHLKQALELLNDRPPHTAYITFQTELQALGFDPGWGDTAARVRETLELLRHLILNPEPALLEMFVSRIPAIFNVALVSIHGWVSQELAIDRPETTGQVIYVLEQACSLEKRLWEDVQSAGLDHLIQPNVAILTRLIPNCESTHCDLPLEKINGTKNAWIIRVPFQSDHPQLTQNWVPKSKIWPYLENFAIDAEAILLKHFQGSPGLIMGNYSDGNLVAYLLSQRMNVTHGTIAHTLEKPKHLYSDLYWQEMEPEHHFSAQFTADLISMNAADFIITSSYQEIMGTPDTLGQYESYKCFSMPNLYHVIDGINLFSPKFNRIPPGVDEAIYFPYTQTADSNTEHRLSSVSTRVSNILFTDEAPRIIGKLADPGKTPIFAIAPLVSSKNFVGLAECFGKSTELKNRCNLILITNTLDPSQTQSAEEAEAIAQLHAVIDQYQLHDHIRWIGTHWSSADLGEAYRVIADRQGIFVHFALYTSFGRTILEAMVSGLPTFVSEFGGSIEILGVNHEHFQVNPTDLDGAARKILDFLEQCENQPGYWQEISDWAMQQIRSNYTWALHTKQLLILAKMYSFWNFVFHDNRQALLRYLDTLFHLIYKPRSEIILKEDLSA
jgi:sucrose synthase